MGPEHLDTLVIRSYLASLSGRVSPSSIGRRLSALRSLCRYLVRWEVIEQNAHASKELLKEKVTAGLSVDKPERAVQILDQWAQRQAEMLVELLQAL